MCFCKFFLSIVELSFSPIKILAHYIIWLRLIYLLLEPNFRTSIDLTTIIKNRQEKVEIVMHWYGTGQELSNNQVSKIILRT